MKKVIGLTLVLLGACGGETPPPAVEPAPEQPQAAEVAPPEPYAGHVAYAGATIWDGTGGRALANATLVTKDGRVVAVLEDQIAAGAEVIDLAGRFIVPGFINAHGHVSGRWADDSVVDLADRVRGDLALYARYGVTTVLSLGGEPPEAAAVRSDQSDTALNHARFYMAGAVIADTDPVAARATVASNVEMGADWLKIRVDDNLGAGQKMPWPAVQAVFDASVVADKRVATHIFYMDDAARVLDMGSGLIAHSVRDRQVDDAFVAKMLSSDVCYVPTFTRELSTFVYGERPDFFDDPFFLEAAKPAEMERVSDPQFMSRMASSPTAAGYRQALQVARVNLRILAGSGVPIAFGTDSGPAGRFPGYFEHIEFFMMVDAGLTPRESLLSATSVAADCLGLDDVGTLEPGKQADFLVLTQNPLTDIRATRSIESVFISGNEVR